jgi:hypothetical protein
MEEAGGEAIGKGTNYRVTGATSTVRENGQPPLLGGWPSSCFIWFLSPGVNNPAKGHKKTPFSLPLSREGGKLQAHNTTLLCDSPLVQALAPHAVTTNHP